MAKAVSAIAERAPAPQDNVRVYREKVSGDGRPASLKLAMQAPCPTVPVNNWPWMAMPRDQALAKVKTEQAKFEFSGFNEEGAYYWARNAPTKDLQGDVAIWRWRLVPWD